MHQQDHQGWPASAAGVSATATFVFNLRANEGTGTFTGTGAPPALAIVVPQGRTGLITVSAMREAVVTHVLNQTSFMAWWNPGNTTPEAALRAAMAEWRPLSNTTPYVYVWFDGQFGSVLVS